MLPLLVLWTALAAPGDLNEARLDFEQPFFEPRHGPVSLLPPSGKGTQMGHQRLCDYAQAAGLLVGNFGCLNGDGSSLGLAFSRAGTTQPTSTAQRVCSDGVGCNSVPVQRFDNGKWVTGNVGSPSGDFSACTWVKRDAVLPTAGQILISKDDTATGRGFNLFITANTGLVTFEFFGPTSGTSGSFSTSTGVMLGEAKWVDVCATYDFVTHGTSVARIFVDGVSVAGSNDRPGPLNATTIPWGFGARSGSGVASSFYGSMRWAFFTEKALSMAEVAALHRVATGHYNTSAGVPLSVSRSTARTCLSSDGSLTTLPPNVPCVGGPQNRIKWSEGFDNAYWSKAGGGSVAANNATYAAPDGTLTADALVAGTLNYTSVQAYDVYTLDVQRPVTQSVWVRAETGTVARVDTQVSAPVLGNACSAALTNLGTTWTRLSCNAIFPAGATLTPKPVVHGTLAQNPTGTRILAWGAQLELGAPLPSPYVRTEGSASYNLLSWSDELDRTVPWTSNNGTGTVVTANTWTRPGAIAATGDTIEDISSGTSSGRLQTLSGLTIGQAYAFSCWFQAGTATSLRMVLGGTTCSYTLSATPERKMCTHVATATSHNCAALIRTLGSELGTIHVADCQVEPYDTKPGTYVRTEGTEARPGLEVAGAVTNLLLRSEEFGTAPWGATGLTVTANDALAPDGTKTADLVAKADTTASRSVAQSATLAATTTYTFSGWMRASATSDRASFGIFCGAFLTGATAKKESGAGAVTVSGNIGVATGLSQTEWTRVSYTGTTAATTACSLLFYPDGTASTTIGNGNYFWGAQLETGPVASRYVRTEGTQGLSNADNASIPTPSVLSDAEGCVAATFQYATTPTTNARILKSNLSGLDGYLVYLSSGFDTVLNMTDATAPISVSGLADMRGRPVRVRVWWHAASSTKGIAVDAESKSASNAYDGTILGALTYFGSRDGTQDYLNGRIWDVKFGSSRNGCK